MATAARRTTANLTTTRRRAPARRNTRKGAASASSPARVREKQRVKTLAYGGLTSFAFGYLQSKLNLPSIKNVPDSLTYGTAGLALGLLTKSNVVMDCSTGPFFAGLHNIALHGFSDEVGGEFDGDSEQVAGEFDSGDSVQGEFDTVTAGDFRDL